MRFKIDWAIVGRKYIVFALFYFVFEGNCLSSSPRGVYIWRGVFDGGLTHGGAYFRNFTVSGLRIKDIEGSKTGKKTY